MAGQRRLSSPADRKPSPDFATLSLRPLSKLLETGSPAATVDRLFQSDHVKDLKLIVAVAFLGVILVFWAGILLSIENEVQSQWPSITSSESNWIFLHISFSAAGKFLSFFIPVLAVFGGILAWAYQVGSARLGVVDLFACEISTLCRVATVVDTVRRYVEKFDRGPGQCCRDTHPPTHSFTSQENYFPVFENNTRDLQTLEARVVIDVTAFYTYMKAFRNSLRALAEIRPEPAEQSQSNELKAAGPWHATVINIVYTLFLGMESARHAITSLVEFEPEQAERTVVILISELEAYRFLCIRFPNEDDMRHQRIMLRNSDYRALVPKLCHMIEVKRALEKITSAGGASQEPGETLQWEPAWRLLPELKKRYDAAMRLSDSVIRPAGQQA